MPLYESRANALNKIKVEPEITNSVVVGSANVINHIIGQIKSNTGKCLKIAFDGWYGVEWESIITLIKAEADKNGLKVTFKNFADCFVSEQEIEKYKSQFITDDPAFGWSNTKGSYTDILSETAISNLVNELNAATANAIIVYGYGAAIEQLSNKYDLRFYFDHTQQHVLWKMWDGKLVPFGAKQAKPSYHWKEFYYCDFYIMHHHKPYAFEQLDFYVDNVNLQNMRLVPRKAYDTIIQTLVKYPVKEVKIFQPGPWGAYRYEDLFDVPGLGCNAWNELAGPELNILVDVGNDVVINMPVTNCLQYAEEFVGPYINENLPGMIPFDVWLNDGYFPQPTPQERTSMPIHNHPSTDYVKRHFNEPLGRYETYYIAEAYEGANTMMGFKDDVDLEEWERKCRESWDKQEPIADWKEFIKIWPSNVGDLYLIPPGTTHGHGGNQMVLEMDTSASPCGTEYSFFTYDFMRPSWDDKTQTMTAKPMNMHLEHGFDTDKWRREDYVKENLHVRQPEVVKWNKEFALDRYKMTKEMPFEIERIHFTKRAVYNTDGRFMHIPTLTVGKNVTIRSLTNPEWHTNIDQWQACLIPAGFGEYEIINNSEGACTLVYIRWRKG